MVSFGRRLDGIFATQGQLCLGIDPHPFLLDAWGLGQTADGVREFGLRAVEAAAGTVGIVKPQVAFFERHGSAGYAALETVLAAARAAGLLVIADVKRGDLGTSVSAYGQAWLSPGSPLEVDAMTVVAYQGVGSLSELLAFASENGKGAFVLAATSNPEAVETQTAVRQAGEFARSTVAAAIVSEVDALNPSDEGLGSVGVVIGATVNMDDYGIGVGSLAFTPILAPGFGEQGAALSDVGSLFGDAWSNTIVSVSRSALRAGPGGLAAELSSLAGVLEGTLGR